MSRIFQSVHHPKNTATGSVYARTYLGGVGAFTVPLMIGATTSALLGRPIWGYLVWGLPLALAGAWAWTRFTLSTTVAELRVRAGQCAVRSVLDVLRGAEPEWDPLYGLEESSERVELLMGWTTQIIRRTEWPDFRDLRPACRSAAGRGENVHPEVS